MLIIESIKEKTSAIKNFSKKEVMFKKSAEQKLIDTSYKKAINEVNGLITEIVNISNQTNFVISPLIKERITELLSACQSSSRKESVEIVDVNGITAKEKEVRSLLQYEWNSYYSRETASVEDVLNVVRGIANVNITALLYKMRAAKTWNKDINVVIEMMNAISEANSLIDKMKLTDTTVAFLRKVINKTATLEDITDEVMSWLQAEGIKGKVKISF